MNKEQVRFGKFRADSVNEANRTAEFIISTEAVDTYGTSFKASGWDLNRYGSNPVVTYQHADWSSDPDMVIGTSEVRIDGDKLLAVLTFENAEDNPLADKIFKKVKNKILRGASVRARVHEASMGRENEGEDPEVLYFTKQELLSWSIVTVQSNPEALARNDKALQEIRSTCPKPTKEEETTGEKRTAKSDKEKTLSRFEAQTIINENNFENEKVN